MNKVSKQDIKIIVDKVFEAIENTGTKDNIEANTILDIEKIIGTSLKIEDDCTGVAIDYPEVFVNENFEYAAMTPGIKEKALADGLAGWDLFLSGHIPRKQFGNSMIKIETLLGANASQVNLTKIANRYKEFGLDNLREVAHQQYEKNPGDPSNIEMSYDDMSKMVAKKIKATL